MDKRQAIIQAVEFAKTSQFKATGIKVELEAQLGRGNSSGEFCDGRIMCPECDGDWSSGCDCGECYSDEDCEFCDEGYNTCEGDCGRRHSGEPTVVHNWGSTQYCQDWILKKLKPLGLAMKNPTRLRRGHDGRYGEYKPKGALVFAKFYRDGSVDSELTFTLSLEDPRTVLLLPKVVSVFKAMADEIGNGIQVQGAGMHMAWINDPQCKYPTQSLREHEVMFANFKRSMSLLMPALFFLGSSNEKARRMGYRGPGVGRGKSVAINYNGALEYRVFDTCYDNPDIILDNVVVMSRTLRYWAKKFRKTGMQKITKEVSFGNDHDDTLIRLYQTVEHIDLLNQGLARLKPSYYTIGEVKRQRKFGLTKRTLNSKQKVLRKQAEVEYKEYEERFNWKILRWENRFRADLIDNHAAAAHSEQILTENKEQVLQDIEQRVKELVEREKQNKQPLDKYITSKVVEFEKRLKGQYRLTA